MANASCVFVSAVTSELGWARLATRDVLLRMQVEPVVQDEFPTDYRTIVELLRATLKQCDATICLLGFRFGAEPKDRPEGTPRRSYTQLEYDIALELGKPIYLLFWKGGDDRAALNGDDEQRRLQSEHRVALLASDRIWYEFASLTELRRIVSEIPFLPAIEAKQLLRILPAWAEQLVGRAEALSRLDDIWYDPGVRVLPIVGWAGVGKTSLIARWLANLQGKRWLGAERVFVWAFGGQSGEEPGSESSDQFVARALSFFGGEAASRSSTSPLARAEQLAELIAEHRSLLILDGVDSLQHPPGPLGGQLRDRPMRILLESLCTNSRGLCVVTTRESLEDLQSWRTTTAPEWLLENLDENSSVELLQRAGVSGPEEELRSASREVGCHALTLDLLGHYLVAAHHGDVRRRGLISLDTADARLSGGRVFGVMKAYEVWFGSSEGDGPRQLAVLRLIGLFDRPADEECLAALRNEPKIDGLCDALAGITSDEWSIAVSNLESVHLVRRIVEDAAPISGFDFAQAERARKEGILGAPRHSSPARTITALEAHPLVREYFANRLRSENPEAFRAGHERLYRLLAQSVPYWPEGIEGLAPLYQAVVHGCLAGLPTDACANVYRDRIQRSRYGSGYSTSILGAVASDLAVVRCFFADPWGVPQPSLPAPAQAWVLRDAAVSLEAAGRLSEALDPLRKSVRQTVAAGTSREATSRCNDLSRLELTLGQIDPAITSAREAIGLAGRVTREAVEDSARRQALFWSMVARATLGDALAQAGSVTEAQDSFREAEAIQREHDSRPALFSLQGFQYCDVLLADAERAAWQIYSAGLGGSVGAEPDASAFDVDPIVMRGDLIEDIGRRDSILLDQGLGNLVRARVILYWTLLGRRTDRPIQLQKALAGAGAATEQTRRSALGFIVPCLLCRAWIRHALGDAGMATADLDLAWTAAVRGSMELYCADIELYRARLLRDRDALERAAKRIERWQYGRRRAELNDARAFC